MTTQEILNHDLAPDAAHLLLIDAFDLVHRAAYRADGDRQAAQEILRGQVQRICFAARTCATRIAVFDGPDSGDERRVLYPAYKPHSSGEPRPALDSLEAVAPAIFESLGFECAVSMGGCEADDVIATLAASHLITPDSRVFVSTSDKDLSALMADDRVTLLRTESGGRVTQLGPDFTLRRFGVRASQLLDYLALCGDACDAIPGVTGIGAKRAAALLAEYGDADVVFRAARDRRLKGAMARMLCEGLVQFRLSRELVRLRTDATWAVCGVASEVAA